MKIFSRLLFVLSITAASCTSPFRDEVALVKNAQHVVVYYQPDRFAGWPANNGAFMFENDEMLVGFTEAPYKKRNGHNADKPFLNWLARSTDGGLTWSTADPEGYAGDFGDEPELKTLDNAIEYTKPGFAMRVVGAAYHGAEDGRAHFFYTYDAGKTWNGPYGFGSILSWPAFQGSGLDELTPRTDYIVQDSNSCLLFFSARQKEKFASDRLFCIQSTDGGKTYEFVGWVIGPEGADYPGDSVEVPLFEDASKNPAANACRAAMSQSKKLPDGSIVSVIRRKYIIEAAADKNWIDAYVSKDNGKTWSYLSTIAGTGEENGNPPAMTITKDGRLCVVYGERATGTIRVQYSSDLGHTWTIPQVLMDGFWSEDMEFNDLGYPRVLTRADGKLVAVYYYSTSEHPHHLRATIWQP